MRWEMTNRANRRARRLADRHYSRQKPGTTQFVKPGRCLVFITRDGKCLWVTSWPFADYVKHAWAGAWECSLFRSEGDDTASELITEAVAATRACYGTPPDIGFVTFIDPAKVKPVVVRGLPTFGYSWRKAGWRYDGTTEGGKLAFVLKPEDMPEPDNPVGFALSEFARRQRRGTL